MSCLIGLLTITLVFIVAARTQAQETGDSPIEAYSYFRYMPSRDRDEAAGKVSLIESGSQFSYNFKVAGKMPVTISVGEEFVGINKKNISVPLPSHLTIINSDLDAYLPTPYEKWFLGVGASPSFNSDDWDGSTESFRMSGRTFLVYQPKEELTLMAGVAFYPGYVDNVLPVFGMIYKPNDKLSFNLTPNRPNITYRVNERLAAFVTGGFDFEEFQISRGSGSAVLQYRQDRVGTGVEFDINKNIQSFVTLGGAFNRFLEYRDNIGKVEIKNGLYTEVRLQAKF
jgi:hypothetical protein